MSFAHLAVSEFRYDGPIGSHIIWMKEYQYALRMKIRTIGDVSWVFKHFMVHLIQS